MKNKKIIIIQDINLYLLITYLLKFIVSNEIYLCKKFYPKNPFNILNKYSISEKIIKFFFRKKIRNLDLDFIKKINYTSNEESIKLLQDNEFLLKKLPLNKYLLDIIGSNNIIKYIQMVYCYKFTDLLFLENYLNQIINTNDNGTKITLFHTTKPYFYKNFFKSKLKKLDLNLIENTNRFKCITFIFINFLYLIYLLFLNLFKFKLKINKRKFILVQPMLYGFNNMNIKKYKKPQYNEPKLINRDDYLYSNDLKKGDIIHIYDGKWKFSKEKRKENDEYMSINGLSYLTIKNFNININIILEIFFLIKTLFFLLLNKYSKINFFDLLILLNINSIYINRKILYENIEYKKEFFRDDYAAKATLQSIINSQHNIESIAIAHHIHPIAYPSISFIHFDKYFVFTELNYNFSEKNYKNMEVIKIGRENLDDLYETNLKIKNKSFEKKTITIILPSYVAYFNLDVWKNLYNALEKFLNKNQSSKIYIKQRHPRIQKYNFNNLQNISDDIICETDISTHELLIRSDLIITHTTSFSIWELAALKKKFFILDFHPIQNNIYFPGAMKKIFISQEKQIYDILSLKQNIFSDKNLWQYFYEKCNYYFDGKNKERIHKAINN